MPLSKHQLVGKEHQSTSPQCPSPYGQSITVPSVQSPGTYSISFYMTRAVGLSPLATGMGSAVWPRPLDVAVGMGRDLGEHCHSHAHGARGWHVFGACYSS